MSLQKTKLPIINLSWKKTPNSKLSKTNFEEAVDLRGIYYILMDMLIKAYKFSQENEEQSIKDIKKYVDEFCAINPQIIYFQTEEMTDNAEIMEIK